jgi:phage shock protein PspC (stress-responsive transcriptional regulator)
MESLCKWSLAKLNSDYANGELVPKFVGTAFGVVLLGSIRNFTSNFGLSVVLIMVCLIIIITFHSLPICNALLVYFVPILLLPRDLAFTNILPLQSKGFLWPSNPTIQVPKVILKSKSA